MPILVPYWVWNNHTRETWSYSINMYLLHVSSKLVNTGVQQLMGKPICLDRIKCVTNRLSGRSRQFNIDICHFMYYRQWMLSKLCLLDISGREFCSIIQCLNLLWHWRSVLNFFFCNLFHPSSVNKPMH